MPRPGDVLGFQEMCGIEGKMLQQGMHFRRTNGHSVLLMSRRRNAPYPDRMSPDGKRLYYVGHDAYGEKRKSEIDQPLINGEKALTANGKFFTAAQEAKKSGVVEIVRVYEKIASGIWVFNGLFRLVDARFEYDGRRNVCLFELELIESENDVGDIREKSDISPGRLIPTDVKLAVWKRDKGRCQFEGCGATSDLHFDHIIPFSLGGSSADVNNVQLLCGRHNVRKGARII